MAAPQASSRLEMLQARFQQKQLQEKEQKLLQLYDQQQQRAYQVVQRGSAGSNGSSSSIGHQTVTRNSSTSQTTSTTQGGKVRQMFDERRQTTTSVKGIDRSYPLEPLENKPRKQTSNGTVGVAPQRNAGTLTVNRQSVTVKRQGRADLNSNLNTYHHEEVHTRQTFQSTTQGDQDEEEFGDENDVEDRYPNGNERHENHHQVLDQDTIDNNRMMAKLHLMQFDETMKHRVRKDLESEEFPEELMVEVPDKLPKRTATRKLSQAEARLERFKNANAKRNVTKNSTTIGSVTRKPTTVKSTPRRSESSPTSRRKLYEVSGASVKEDSSKKRSRESSSVEGVTGASREIASPKKDSARPNHEKSATTVASRNRLSDEHSVKDSRKTEARTQDSGKTSSGPEFFCVESEKSATTYSLRPSNVKEGRAESQNSGRSMRLIDDAGQKVSKVETVASGKTSSGPEFFCVESEKSATTYSLRPSKVEEDRAEGQTSGRSMKMIDDAGQRVNKVSKSPALKRTPLTSILKKGQGKRAPEAELRGLEVIKKIKESTKPSSENQRKHRTKFINQETTKPGLRGKPGPKVERKGKTLFSRPESNVANSSPDKTLHTSDKTLHKPGKTLNSRTSSPVKDKPDSSTKDRVESRPEFFCVESERSATTFSLRPEARSTPDHGSSSPEVDSWKFERMEESCSRTFTPDSLRSGKPGTGSPEFGDEENDRSATSFGWRPETIEKRRMSELSGRSSGSETTTVERAKTPSGRFYLHVDIADDKSRRESPRALRGIFEKSTKPRSLDDSKRISHENERKTRTNGIDNLIKDESTRRGSTSSPVLRSLVLIRDIAKGQSRPGKVPEQEGLVKGFEDPKKVPKGSTGSREVEEVSSRSRGRGSFASITEMDEEVHEVRTPGLCPGLERTQDERRTKPREIGKTYSRADNDRLRSEVKANSEYGKGTEDTGKLGPVRLQRVEGAKTRVSTDSREESVSFLSEKPARKRGSVLRSNVFEPIGEKGTRLSKISRVEENFGRESSSEPSSRKEKGQAGTVKRGKSSVEKRPEQPSGRRKPETKVDDLLRSSGGRKKPTPRPEVAGKARKSSTGGETARLLRSMELVRLAMSGTDPGQKISGVATPRTTRPDVEYPPGTVLAKKDKPIARPLDRGRRNLSAGPAKHFQNPPRNKVKRIQTPGGAQSRGSVNLKGTTDKSGKDVASKSREAKSVGGVGGVGYKGEKICGKSFGDQAGTREERRQEILKSQVVAVYSSEAEEEETFEGRTVEDDRYRTVSRLASVSRYSSVSSGDKHETVGKLTNYRDERSSYIDERTEVADSVYQRTDSVESALRRFDSIDENRTKTFDGLAVSSAEIEHPWRKSGSLVEKKDSASGSVKGGSEPVSLKALDRKSSPVNETRNEPRRIGSRVQESRTKIAKDLAKVARDSPRSKSPACRRKLFEDSEGFVEIDRGHVVYSSFFNETKLRESMAVDNERGRSSLPPVRQLRSIEDIRRSIRGEAKATRESPVSATARPKKTLETPKITVTKSLGSPVMPRNGVARLSRTVKSPSPDSRRPTEMTRSVTRRRSVPQSPSNSPDSGTRRTSNEARQQETKTTRRPAPGRGPEVVGKKSTIGRRSTDVVDGPVQENGVHANETRNGPAIRPDPFLIEPEDGSSREAEAAATKKPLLRKQSIEKQQQPSRPVSSISSVSSASSTQGQAPGSRGRMATRTSRTPISGATSSRTTASGRIGGNASAVENLVPCKMCGRRFAQDRVSLHEQICARTAQKKRKQFDAMMYRVRGTDLEPFVKKGVAKKQSEPKPKKPEVRSNWRKKHEEFINAIRSAKQVQAHLAAGGKLSDLPPPPASDTSDYIQCPHCGRRFNQTAAERHIPKCEHMLHNKPRPPKTKR